MSMLWISVICFALAALGGVTMLVLRLQEKAPPMPLAAGHGLAAAAGLVSLLLTVTGGHATRFATYAVIGFAGAALGGFYLASMHLRGKTHPVALILGHGTVAVASLVVLLLAVLRG